MAKGLNDLGAALRRGVLRVPEEKVARGLLNAAHRVRELLVKRTPVGEGAMRNAWSAPIPLPRPQIGYDVRNDAPHAPMVEHGTRPHMPPVDVIARWVRLKFQLSEADARKVAWAVAMKIKEHGTKPQHVIGGAERDIRRIIREEIVKCVRSVDGK